MYFLEGRMRLNEPLTCRSSRSRRTQTSNLKGKEEKNQGVALTPSPPLGNPASPTGFGLSRTTECYYFFREVKAAEVVKFLPDVLDALFSILMENRDAHYTLHRTDIIKLSIIMWIYISFKWKWSLVIYPPFIPLFCMWLNYETLTTLFCLILFI